MTEPLRRDWCEEHNQWPLVDGLCPECEARRNARLAAPMTKPQPNGRDREMATAFCARHRLRYAVDDLCQMFAAAREEGRRSAIETTLNILYEEGGLMKARAEGRHEAFEAVINILHEEGWLGRSEQRIRALAGGASRKNPPIEG